MGLEIDYLRSREEWDSFLKEKEGSFMQSVQWGNFKELYQRAWRIEAREGGKISGVCQLFEERNLFGNFLYVPHGPFAREKETRELLLSKVKNVAQEKGFFFLRTEPVQEVPSGKRAVSRFQPQKTIINDILKEDEEILANFSSSTRYNVRLAQKKKLFFEQSQDIDSFLNLLEKTKQRKSFFVFSRDYLKKLLEKTSAELYIVKKKEKVLAASIVFFFGNTATSLFSATDYEHKKLKAPNLLRFELFKIARDKGCKRFDGWGIDDQKFPGVSSFKRGFGGNEVIYPEGRDIPYNNLRYFCYSNVVKIKNHIR